MTTPATLGAVVGVLWYGTLAAVTLASLAATSKGRRS